METIRSEELDAAVSAYGLTLAAVLDHVSITAFASTHKVRCDDGATYLVRVRHEAATAEQVLFAREWALAVSAEVPVPIPLAPLGQVPRIGRRCVDVSPYIAHENNQGHAVCPDAWVTVGGWLGAMHRLGLPLVERAPVGLFYGNHPSVERIDAYFAKARESALAATSDLLPRAEAAWLAAKPVLASVKPTLPRGVVHGDMHFWNVLYTAGDPVAIIDLDFLQQGPMIYDPAYAASWLTYWERDRGEEWVGVMDRYLRAYEQGRGTPLTPLEIRALPWSRIEYSMFFFVQSFLLNEDIDKQLLDLSTAEQLLKSAK